MARPKSKREISPLEQYLKRIAEALEAKEKRQTITIPYPYVPYYQNQYRCHCGAIVVNGTYHQCIPWNYNGSGTTGATTIRFM